MSGTSQQQQTQQQQSVSNPWAPTQPLLQDILNNLQQTNLSPTSAQLGAVNALQTGANSIPNWGGAASGAVGNAFGTNTNPQQGLLSSSLGALNTNLGGYASGANLNPYNTPGFSQALNTMNQDITNQVNGQFAAAGRDLSPANSTALARGLSQGEGGLLANQYNQNVGNMFGANNALFGGAGSTAQGLTAQQLAALQAQQSGINAAGMLPGLYTAPGQAQLGAANTAYGLPFQNIGLLSSLVNPIAALGGQTSGTGSQTGTNTMSGAQQFGTITGGLGNLGKAGLLF